MEQSCSASPKSGQTSFHSNEILWRGRNKPHGLSNLHLLVIYLVLLTHFYIINKYDKFVISAHRTYNHETDNKQSRCLHVARPLEQVHHLWLDKLKFTTSSIDTADDQFNLASKQDNNDVRVDGGQKFKRHVGERNHDKGSGREDGNFVDGMQDAKIAAAAATNGPRSLEDDQPKSNANFSSGSIQSTLWNLLKRLERPFSASQQQPQQSSSAADELVPMRINVHYDASVMSLEKEKADIIKGTVIPSVVKFFEEALSIKRKYTIERFRIARRCPDNTIYYAKELIDSPRAYCMDRCEDHAVCGEIIVPREHLSACAYCNRTSRRCTTNYSTEGKGVEATQLLLYVSAKQTARCRKDQTIAYAAHCAQDTKTDRPVAGHANLCPTSISADQRDLRALIATVKHELTHVLGFSVSLFAYYRDEHGRPLLEREPVPGPLPVDPETGYAIWSDKIIKKVVRKNWLTADGPIDKEIHVMVTPTVVREVRRHFNCATLEGAELEDQGSDGTSMTHLEKRLFENEAMTGTHTQNSVYSRITLAVLQDTGWYVANFSRAEPLAWGKDLGCEFAMQSCKSWMDKRRARKQSIKPFCNRVKSNLLQIGCTEDRNSKAVCNMRHWPEPLPAKYRNFAELDGLDVEIAESVSSEAQYRNVSQLAHYGGSVDLADYCPFIQEFSWQARNVTTRGSRCDQGHNSIEADKNPTLEHYGPDSKCFEHSRRWEQKTCHYKRQWHHYGAGCYRYSCTPTGHMLIIVGNHSYPCYYSSQLIHIEQVVQQWLHNGSLVCPSCAKICPASKCVEYDSQIIDTILSLAHNGDLDTLFNSAPNNETLELIAERAYNAIIEHDIDESRGDGESTTRKQLDLGANALAKYIPVLLEARQMISPGKVGEQQTLMSRFRDNAPFIFTSPIVGRALHHPRPYERSSSICASGSRVWPAQTSAFDSISNSVLISLLVALATMYGHLNHAQSFHLH